MKKSYLILLLIFFSTLFFSCMSNKILRENLEILKSKQKRELVLVVFGDSVSGGFGVTGIRDSYGGLLKQKIGVLFDRPVSFINSSRADESYMFARRRIQADVLSFRPDITFVMLGLVDAFTPNIPPSNQKKSIETFYSILKKSNTFVVVLTTTGLRDFRGTDDPRAQTLNDYNQLIRDSAMYFHYPIIDVAWYMEKFRLSNPEEYLTLFDSPFLLNEKGNGFIADFIFQRLETNFEKIADDTE